MNRKLTESDYMEAWEGIHPMEKLQGNSNQMSYVQVAAEVRLLSRELTISVDILQRIQDSVHVLSQSLEER